MITCECGRSVRSIKELVDVKNLGFALFGRCPDCGINLPANTLWKFKGYLIKKKDRIAVATPQ